MKTTSLTLLASLAIAAAACSKPSEGEGDPGGDKTAAAAAPKPGIGSTDEVSAAIEEALKLGESTWPGAKVGGVKDATAKSGLGGVQPRVQRPSPQGEA